MKVYDGVLLIKEKIEGKQYGKEIVGICPYCKSDKHKFYVNVETGQFSCKRGSCGEKGNLTTLFKTFNINETIEYEDTSYNVKKNSEKEVEVVFDSSSVIDITSDNLYALDYMMSRGISLETLNNSDVKFAQNNGAFVFITKANNKIKNVLYRTQDKKFFIERGGEQRLWGTDKLNFDNNTLYITEGHIDCLTLREMGIENVVSIPNGCASHEYIDKDWELLNKFSNIVLCYDNDAPGKKGMSEVKSRLDFASLYELEYGEYKDINEMFMGDCEALYKTINSPKQLILDGFVSLTNVSTNSGVSEKLYSTGLKQFDKIFGGVGLNQSTIITSESGVGKTTVVCNMLKGLIAQDEKVAVWSGELSNKMLKTWIYATIGGERALEYKEHPFRDGEFIMSINQDYERKIDDLVKDKLYVYDGNNGNGFDMIKKFEYIHKRHGVKFFFIDNLSILDMSVKGAGQWEGESEFSKAVASFTRNNAVHLYLIAHPTKVAINADSNFIDQKGNVKPLEKYTQQQVRGSATLVNLIHNVLFLSKAKDHEKAWFIQAVSRRVEKQGITDSDKKLLKSLEEEFSVLAYLVKNRGQGNTYENALLGYDKKTRRVYGLTSKEEDLSIEILKDEDTTNNLIDITEEFNMEDF